MQNCIAIIIARGGSKRIPGKNIRNFLGAPIIKFPIEAALKVECFDELMVSTDDNKIAIMAKKFGANVPFLRSACNASDYATTADVLYEVLDNYNKMGRDFKYCCCIYPTAPFITKLKIEEAFVKLTSSTANSIISMIKYSHPIERSFRIKEDGTIKMNYPEYANTRTQDLPISYHDAGQFYIFKVENFLIERKLFTSNSIIYETSILESQDIDCDEDWSIAELKYKQMIKGIKLK